MTIHTQQLFAQVLRGGPHLIGGIAVETMPGTEPDLLFGPGGGDYVGINSYDARLTSQPEPARIALKKGDQE